LIEVLLAIAILGTALVVLLTGAARCLAAVKQAQYYQEAQWTFAMGEAEYPLICTNEVDEMEVAEVRYDNGFTFSRRVEDDEDEDGLFEIKSRVTWSARGRESFEEVVALLFIPETEDGIWHYAIMFNLRFFRNSEITAIDTR